jgi:hypothetical protein
VADGNPLGTEGPVDPFSCGGKYSLTALPQGKVQKQQVDGENIATSTSSGAVQAAKTASQSDNSSSSNRSGSDTATANEQDEGSPKQQHSTEATDAATTTPITSSSRTAGLGGPSTIRYSASRTIARLKKHAMSALVTSTSSKPAISKQNVKDQSPAEAVAALAVNRPRGQAVHDQFTAKAHSSRRLSCTANHHKQQQQQQQQQQAAVLSQLQLATSRIAIDTSGDAMSCDSFSMKSSLSGSGSQCSSSTSLSISGPRELLWQQSWTSANSDTMMHDAAAGAVPAAVGGGGNGSCSSQSSTTWSARPELLYVVRKIQPQAMQGVTSSVDTPWQCIHHHHMQQLPNSTVQALPAMPSFATQQQQLIQQQQQKQQQLLIQQQQQQQQQIIQQQQQQQQQLIQQQQQQQQLIQQQQQLIQQQQQQLIQQQQHQHLWHQVQLLPSTQHADQQQVLQVLSAAPPCSEGTAVLLGAPMTPVSDSSGSNAARLVGQMSRVQLGGSANATAGNAVSMPLTMASAGAGMPPPVVLQLVPHHQQDQVVNVLPGPAETWQEHPLLLQQQQQAWPVSPSGACSPAALAQVMLLPSSPANDPPRQSSTWGRQQQQTVLPSTHTPLTLTAQALGSCSNNSSLSMLSPFAEAKAILDLDQLTPAGQLLGPAASLPAACCSSDINPAMMIEMTVSPLEQPAGHLQAMPLVLQHQVVSSPTTWM